MTITPRWHEVAEWCGYWLRRHLPADVADHIERLRADGETAREMAELLAELGCKDVAALRAKLDDLEEDAGAADGLRDAEDRIDDLEDELKELKADLARLPEAAVPA